MTLRKAIFWIHLGLGLLALLPMVFLSVTGLLLAFEPQLTDDWAHETRTLRTKAARERISLDALVTKAMGPESGKVSSIAILADSTAYVELREAKRRFVRVDPWSGEVQARTGALQSFLGTIESLHQSLASGETGRTVTGASALVCLLLSVSGLVIWWPRKLVALRHVLWPRSGLRGRARNWQWHNAFGIMSLLPLFVLGLTGTVMAFPWAEKVLYAVTLSHEPPRLGKKAGSLPSVPGWKGRQWQTWLDTAKTHAPAGWTGLRLRAPEKPGKGPVINFRGRADGAATGNLVLAPDGSFLSYKPAGTDLVPRLRALARPLHTGVFLGLPGQLLIILAALSALVLAWTGGALSWRRFFR